MSQSLSPTQAPSASAPKGKRTSILSHFGIGRSSPTSAAYVYQYRALAEAQQQAARSAVSPTTSPANSTHRHVASALAPLGSSQRGQFISHVPSLSMDGVISSYDASSAVLTSPDHSSMLPQSLPFEHAAVFSEHSNTTTQTDESSAMYSPAGYRLKKPGSANSSPRRDAPGAPVSASSAGKYRPRNNSRGKPPLTPMQSHDTSPLISYAAMMGGEEDESSRFGLRSVSGPLSAHSTSKDSPGPSLAHNAQHGVPGNERDVGLFISEAVPPFDGKYYHMDYYTAILHGDSTRSDDFLSSFGYSLDISASGSEFSVRRDIINHCKPISADPDVRDQEIFYYKMIFDDVETNKKRAYLDRKRRETIEATAVAVQTAHTISSDRTSNPSSGENSYRYSNADSDAASIIIERDRRRQSRTTALSVITETIGDISSRIHFSSVPSVDDLANEIPMHRSFMSNAMMPETIAAQIRRLLDAEYELKVSNLHLIPRHLRAILYTISGNYTTVSTSKAPLTKTNASSSSSPSVLAPLQNIRLDGDGEPGSGSRSLYDIDVRDKTKKAPLSRSGAALAASGSINLDDINFSELLGDTSSNSQLGSEEWTQTVKKHAYRIGEFLEMFNQTSPLSRDDPFGSDNKPLDLLLGDVDADKLVLDYQYHLLFESKNVWFRSLENSHFNYHAEYLFISAVLYDFYGQSATRMSEHFHFPAFVGLAPPTEEDESRLLTESAAEALNQRSSSASFASSYRPVTKALYFLPRGDLANYYMLFKFSRRYLGDLTAYINKYYYKPEHLTKGVRSTFQKAKPWQQRDDMWCPFAWAVVRLKDVMDNPTDSVIDQIFLSKNTALSDMDMLRIAFQTPQQRAYESDVRAVPGSYTFRFTRVYLPKTIIYSYDCPDDIILNVYSERKAKRALQDPASASSEQLRTVRAREIHCVQFHRQKRILYYSNNLFVYPLNFDLRNTAACRFFLLHPMQIEISLQTDDSSVPIPVCYSHMDWSTPRAKVLTNVVWNRNKVLQSPNFGDEFKIRLPFPLKPKHTLLFYFYHVHNRKSNRELIGYSILNLYDGKYIRTGSQYIPVFLSTGNYIDASGYSVLFNVRLKTCSVAFPASPPLMDFFNFIDAIKDEDDALAVDKHQQEFNEETMRVLKNLAKISPQYVSYAPMILNYLFKMLREESGDESSSTGPNDAVGGVTSEAEGGTTTIGSPDPVGANYVLNAAAAADNADDHAHHRHHRKHQDAHEAGEANAQGADEGDGTDTDADADVDDAHDLAATNPALIKKNFIFETLVQMVDKYRTEDMDFLNHYIKNIYAFSSAICGPLLEIMSFHLNYSSDAQVWLFAKNFYYLLSILVKSMILHKKEKPGMDFSEVFYQQLDQFVGMDLRVLVENYIERYPYQMVKLGQALGSFLRVMCRIMRRDFVMHIAGKFADGVWKAVQIRRAYSKHVLTTLVDLELAFFKELIFVADDELFFLLSLPYASFAADKPNMHVAASMYDLAGIAGMSPARLPKITSDMVIGRHFLFSQAVDIISQCIGHNHRKIRTKAISFLRSLLTLQHRRQAEQRQNTPDGTIMEDQHRLNTRLNFEIMLKMLDTMLQWKYQCDTKRKTLKQYIDKMKSDIAHADNEIEQLKYAKLLAESKQGAKNAVGMPDGFVTYRNRTKVNEDLDGMIQLRRKLQEAIDKTYQKLDKTTRVIISEKRYLMSCFVHIASRIDEPVLRGWWKHDTLRTNFVLALRECLTAFEYKGEHSIVTSRKKEAALLLYYQRDESLANQSMYTARGPSLDTQAATHRPSVDGVMAQPSSARSDTSDGSSQGSNKSSTSANSDHATTQPGNPSGTGSTAALRDSAAAAAQNRKLQAQVASTYQYNNQGRVRSTTISLFGRGKKKTTPTGQDISSKTQPVVPPLPSSGIRVNDDGMAESDEQPKRPMDSVKHYATASIMSTPRELYSFGSVTYRAAGVLPPIPSSSPLSDNDPMANIYKQVKLEKSMCSDVGVFVLDMLIKLVADNKHQLAVHDELQHKHQTLIGEVIVKEATPLMDSVIKLLNRALALPYSIEVSSAVLRFTKQMLKDYYAVWLMPRSRLSLLPPPPPPPPPPTTYPGRGLKRSTSVYPESSTSGGLNARLTGPDYKVAQAAAIRQHHAASSASHKKVSERNKQADKLRQRLMRLLDYMTSGDVRVLAMACIYLTTRFGFVLYRDMAKPKAALITSLSATLQAMQSEIAKSTLQSRFKGDDVLDMTRLREGFSLMNRMAAKDEFFVSHKVDFIQAQTFKQEVDKLCGRCDELVQNTVAVSSAIAKSNGFEIHRIEDLLHRIVESTANVPELRIFWLRQLARFHLDQKQYVEAANCYTYILAVVFECLVLAGDPHGIVADIPLDRHFFTLNPFLRKKKILIDGQLYVLSYKLSSGASLATLPSVPDVREFTEEGVLQLLQQAASFLAESDFYEHGISLLKIILAFNERSKEYNLISECYRYLMLMSDKIHQCSVDKSKQRYFASYYRVRFFGSKYGELAGKNFIYKLPKHFKLNQMVKLIKEMTLHSLGADVGEPYLITSKSSRIDDSSLDSEKIYVQITSVKPYFSPIVSAIGTVGTASLDERASLFARNVNLTQFYYEQVFQRTEDHAHGSAQSSNAKKKSGIQSMFKVKTVLTVEADAFMPYIKTRALIADEREVLLTPIEVAIEVISERNQSLLEAMYQPIDLYSLQMIVQGAVRATVNGGPKDIVETFLNVDDRHLYEDRFVELLNRKCHEFLFLCTEAVKINAQHVTQPSQREFHMELERGLIETKMLFLRHLFPDGDLGVGFGFMESSFMDETIRSVRGETLSAADRLQGAQDVDEGSSSSSEDEEDEEVDGNDDDTFISTKALSILGI